LRALVSICLEPDVAENQCGGEQQGRGQRDEGSEESRQRAEVVAVNRKRCERTAGIQSQDAPDHCQHDADRDEDEVVPDPAPGLPMCGDATKYEKVEEEHETPLITQELEQVSEEQHCRNPCDG